MAQPTPDYVTDGKIGIDLTATYASVSVGSTSLFPVTPGTRVGTSNNGVYVFARAASTIAQYDVVIFAEWATSATSAGANWLLQAAPILTASAATGGVAGPSMVGIAQTAIASAYYGWIAVNGSNLRANLLVAANPHVPLFTTSTAGSLDDATVSAGWVQGIIAITSATSASSIFVLVNNPQIGGWGAV